MSGELVKLALTGAAASVLIWALSFLAPHCVPEHCWASVNCTLFGPDTGDSWRT